MATHGRTPSACTGGWPTCRARCPCGPTSPAGRPSTISTRLRGKPDKRRKAELLERFELDPTKKARTYSKGNRQKVALVAAFASDVDLLVLDEPTSGLDPLMEAVFTDYLREAKAKGTSVLLSSHILHEVEKVCDTVTIIRSGRSVESGTLDELRHLTRSNVTAVVATDPSALRSHSRRARPGDRIERRGDSSHLRRRQRVDRRRC